MRRSRPLALLAISAAMLVVPGSAQAATAVVDGADTSPDTPACGDAANPCNTVQRGVDQAASGDTVDVRAGSYRESVEVTKPLRLTGAQAGVDARDRSGPETTVASSDHPFVVRSANVRIDGFSLDYRGVSFVGNGGVLANNVVRGGENTSNSVGGENFLISQNSFEAGPYTHVYVSPASDGLQIEDNAFHGPPSNQYASPTAIQAEFGTSELAVTGNESEMPFRITNVSELLIAGNYLDGAGLWLGAAAGADIVANTFDGYDVFGIGLVNGFPLSTNVAIIGNDITNNRRGIYVDPDGYDQNDVVEAHLNRIVGNGEAGVVAPTNGGDSSIDVGAEDNWWGCNGGPGAAGCDAAEGTVFSNPRLLFRLAATPSLIPPGGRTALRAHLTVNSAGVAQPGGFIPPAQVDFSTSDGTLSSSSKELENGAALTTLTAPMRRGALTASATLDAATATVRVGLGIAASPTPPKSTAPSSSPSTASPPFSVSVRRGARRLDRSRRVKLRIRCRGSSSGCRGSLSAYIRGKRRRVGRAAFRLRTGQEKTVRVKLSRSARRLLGRRGKLRLTVRTRAKSGASSDTAVSRFTVLR